MTLRVDVTRGALLEVGREDLAKHIAENRIGDPSCKGGIYVEGRPVADSHLIVRAMRLGHLADPDGATVGCGQQGGADGAFPACDDCRGECDLVDRDIDRPWLLGGAS